MVGTIREPLAAGPPEIEKACAIRAITGAIREITLGTLVENTWLSPGSLSPGGLDDSTNWARRHRCPPRRCTCGRGATVASLSLPASPREPTE